MKKRNVNIDLIKVIAVLSVISVHFFRNTDFYSKEIIGINMYVLTFFRTLFMVCVPLFMLVTGYLMKDKTLNKKYYFGALRVIITYVLSCIICLIGQQIYNKKILNFKVIIKRILDVGSIGYSWYIEMYLGLFLLIPFINLIYNNLNSKREKQVLVLTMITVTSLPGLLNFKYSLMPDWWINIYPLTYYFIGCYLKEYKIKLNKIINILLLILAVFVATLPNIYLSMGRTFVWGAHNDWYSIFNVFTTVLLFIFIINLNMDNVNSKIKLIITKISELSLGVYLSSYIMDIVIYQDLFKDIVDLNFKTYIICVPLVFVTSLGISAIMNIIYKMIDKHLISKIKNKLCD